MPSTFTSSPYLLSHWKRINDMAFQGALPPISDIGWQSLDEGTDSIDIYGGFAARANTIGITSELSRAEEVEREIQQRKSLSSSAQAARGPIPEQDLELICAVAGLVGHEMAHQAVHHLTGDSASHGEDFVSQANKIAEALGLPDVNLKNASYWPNALPTIQRERQRKLTDA